MGFLLALLMSASAHSGAELIELSLPRPGQQVRVFEGLDVWRNAGNQFLVMRVHYTADPARRGDWKYRASPKVGGIRSWRWRKEQEIDWEAQSGSLIFEMFDRDVHVRRPFTIPEHWPRWIHFDPGWTNPAAVIWAAVDVDAEPNLFGYLPIHIYREFYRSRHAAETIARIVSEDSKTVPNPEDPNELTWEWVEEIILDPAAKQEHQSAASPENVTEGAETVLQKFTDAIAREGWDVPITTGNNLKSEAIEEIITRLGRFWIGPNDVPLYDDVDRFREPTEKERADGAQLVTPTLFFHETCVHGPREMVKYRWSDWASNEVRLRRNDPEKPVDKDDHVLTCLFRMVNRLREHRDEDGIDLGGFYAREQATRRWRPTDELLAERHRSLAGRYRKRIRKAREASGL